MIEKFPLRVPFSKKKMPWCSCPLFTKVAYRPAVGLSAGQVSQLVRSVGRSGQAVRSCQSEVRSVSWSGQSAGQVSQRSGQSEVRSVRAVT